MLRSMTGYGCSERTGEDRRVRVEVRSVNQRFLDVQIKAPRTMLRVEDRIRKLVESVLARGRVTVYIEWKSAADESPSVDVQAARELIRQLRLLGEELAVPGDVNLSVVTRFPQIFAQGGDVSGADEVWSSLEPVVSEALSGLLAMREAEGAELGEELAGRLKAAVLNTVGALAPPWVRILHPPPLQAVSWQFCEVSRDLAYLRQ